MRFLVFLLWLATAAIIVFMATQPVSLNTQFITAMIVVIIIAILKLFDRRGAFRAIVLALGTAIVLRYVYWRTFTTIPPVSDLANFIPGVLLYMAEMYSVVMLFLSLFTISDPLNRPRKVLTRD